MSINLFPSPSNKPLNEAQLINSINSIYVRDAYKSLSIEGYQVTEELIEKIANNSWQPNIHPDDMAVKNANVLLVTSGYPWTVIPFTCRQIYLDALDKASVDNDVMPFVRLILEQMGDSRVIMPF